VAELARYHEPPIESLEFHRLCRDVATNPQQPVSTMMAGLYGYRRSSFVSNVGHGSGRRLRWSCPRSSTSS
jgi:hypothetical protein